MLNSSIASIEKNIQSADAVTHDIDSTLVVLKSAIDSVKSSGDAGNKTVTSLNISKESFDKVIAELSRSLDIYKTLIDELKSTELTLKNKTEQLNAKGETVTDSENDNK